MRGDLAARLRGRRSEIEQAVITRVYAVADPKDLDPEYADGLRTAVTAAIDYGLAAIELGEDRTPPPPPALLAQARLAARFGVSLETVLRRCFAGHALVGDFMVEEARRCGLQGEVLQGLLRTQATFFDRVLMAVGEEYGRQADERRNPPEQHRTERIERLLAGELIDTTDLGYEFGWFHLGAIASGPAEEEMLGELATSLDCRLLRIVRGSETWLWLGGRRPIDPPELERIVSADLPPGWAFAIGEPGEGLGGWRLTHHQARAALPIARRRSKPVIRYADVALLAAMLQDDLLTASLRELYLAPLEAERDGGKIMRETLRAYFSAERNVSSAGAALGISRQAVAKRLRAVEERLGRTLGICGMELEAALRLDGIDDRDEGLDPLASADS